MQFFIMSYVRKTNVSDRFTFSVFYTTDSHYCLRSSTKVRRAGTAAGEGRGGPDAQWTERHLGLNGPGIWFWSWVAGSGCVQEATDKMCLSLCLSPAPTLVRSNRF